MGIFVDYLCTPFAGLKDAPTEILKTEDHPIQVNSLTICNRGSQPIRFNLQKKRVEVSDTIPATTTTTTIFYINEYEIKPYETVNFIKKLDLDIFLQYSLTPSIVDSLISFTNGYSQVYDCEISYTVLKDLPITA